MHDLTLVGVHDDGEHLVLAGADGQRYRVRVDEPLRAAVRRDRARLGQLQIEHDARLRPREIQARIRAGESAEQIAEQSGLPVAYVRRYEGPVIAEREFVVRQARAVRIRGERRPDGSMPTLGELVTDRLASRQVSAPDDAWDAWRRADDGIWLVSLTFVAGTRERCARWAYDPQLRHVTPQDDEARWLTDHEGVAATGGAAQRRLMPVRADGYGDPPPRPVSEIDLAEPAPSVEAAAPWPAAATVDLLDSLRERRGRRQRPLPPGEEPEGGDPAQPDLDRALERRFERMAERPLDLTSIDTPPAAHPPLARPDLATDAEVLTLPEPALVLPDDAPVPAGARKAASPGAASGKRNKRASVPSWDDIVFGGRRE